jgi:NAD(P)-dependent dehydrogenase (short-subunit alcohol dehydrogenase family)
VAINLFNLDGRVAVVTGAASGLGQALTIALSQQGADVVGVDVNETGLERTIEQARKAGHRGMACRCDLSESEQIAELFERIDQDFGHVDILINNAYAHQRKFPEDLALEDWNKVMAVNVTAYYLCAQAAGRRMIQRGQGGSIINVSSIAGATALGRGNFVYSISKGAINQMTRELAVEWAKYRIRVNAILPCQIDTPPLKAWLERPNDDSRRLREQMLRGIPMNRFAEASDFIGIVLLLASDAAQMITGALIPVDGGNLALNAGGSHS